MKNYRRLAVNNDGRELLVATEAQRIFPLSLPPPAPCPLPPRESLYMYHLHAQARARKRAVAPSSSSRVILDLSLQFAARKIA